MSDSEITYNSFLIRFLIDRKYRIVRHVVLILFFVFISFNMPYLTCAEFLDSIDNMVLYISLVLLAGYLTGIYLHMYVLLPEFLLKNKYLLYVGTVGLLITFLVCLSFGSDYWLNYYYGREPGHYSFFYQGRTLAIEILGNFFLYALLLAGTSLTILLRRWLQFSTRKKELEKINLKTELEHLKDQINPEFLFNMLDEAGGQASLDPEQASTILMRLSKLLRYQLYDGTREKVLLISEISFIENFLSLAQIRYANLSFCLTKEGNISRKFVPPLLFIPFAIHSVKLLASKATQVDLRLNFRANGQELFFSCISFAPGLSLANWGNSQDLKDVRQRLDLLFEHSYTLKTAGDSSLCKTDLYIKL